MNKNRRPKMKICKVDKEFRLDRSYTEFLRFMQRHHDLPVTQIDSVEGRKRSAERTMNLSACTSQKVHLFLKKVKKLY